MMYYAICCHYQHRLIIRASVSCNAFFFIYCIFICRLKKKTKNFGISGRIITNLNQLEGSYKFFLNIYRHYVDTSQLLYRVMPKKVLLFDKSLNNGNLLYCLNILPFKIDFDTSTTQIR